MVNIISLNLTDISLSSKLKIRRHTFTILNHFIAHWMKTNMNLPTRASQLVKRVSISVHFLFIIMSLAKIKVCYLRVEYFSILLLQSVLFKKIYINSWSRTSQIINIRNVHSSSSHKTLHQVNCYYLTPERAW